MSVASGDRLPAWTWVAPVVAALLLVARFAGWLPASAWYFLIAAAIALAAAIFASVYHAEVIALRLGEPFGSIVLAFAVTVIESALILSLTLTDPDGSDVLARDTVYATVMLVLNGIVGLCLVVGGARHVEQRFGTDAAAAALSVLGTLAVIMLVLPNFTVSVAGPYFATAQLAVVGIVSLVLYSVFLFVQTIRHRSYFLDGPSDQGSPPGANSTSSIGPSNRTALISLALMLVALVTIVLLAKTLSPSLEYLVETAGLPRGVVGVIVAAVVLLPEGIAAVRAAHANRLQSSLNLALGSALATIGLTIPVVAAAALLMGQKLALGLGPVETVLLLLTLFISTVTLATGRTTILQGAVHLVIFIVFLLTAIVQ